MTLTKQGTGAGLVAGPKTMKGGYMVSITIKRATMAAGKRVDAGQTVEVTEADARTLIALGKAVPAGTDAPKAQNRDDAVTKGASKRDNAKKKDKEG